LDANGLRGTFDGVIFLKNSCKNIKITGLELRNTKGHGILLYGNGIDTITIDNCLIHDCESSGIYAYNCKNIEFCYNIVYNVNEGQSYCYAGMSPQEAISFSNVQGFNIHHNTLSKFSKEGIDCKSGCSNGEIHRNTIITSLDSPAFLYKYNHYGIYIDGFSRIDQNIRIYNNKISGYGGSCIVINAEKPESGGAIKDIYVYNNTLDITYKSGFAQFKGIDSLDDCPWKNIYIYSNTITITNSLNYPIRIFPSAKNIVNLVIRDNIIKGKCSIPIFFQKLTSLQISNLVKLSNNIYYRN
jgi:hypothetical protein